MKKMSNIKVNNIQKVCFHDGPGIRTTIFLNSCTLKCPWCANPETSIYNKKYFVSDDCQLENSECSYKVNCKGKFSDDALLDENYDKCPVNAIVKNIKEYSVLELENIILEDQFLYRNEGGVTFSGGEPLIQSSSLLELFKRLKDKDINIVVETSLYSNKKNLQEIIDYVDLFIIDIKILDEIESSKIINGNLHNYLDNIEYVFSKNKNVIFRVPLIKPYITNEKNLKNIYDLLKKYKPMKVEIFKGHNLAKEKYAKLNIDYNKVETVNSEEISIIKNRINKLGVDVEIISF